MDQNKCETILYNIVNNVAHVTFNRPDVHNAFNDKMIHELSDVFDNIAQRQDIRVVIITGKGKSFCAGADLNWMKCVKDYSYEDNLKGSFKLADMLYKIYASPKPTIAKVNGTAIGGGTGLVAVCDIAIASDRAKFSFSEVKIGLIPACISPYVMKKCGEGRCREFFLTGERLSAEKACNAGLINVVTPPDELDKTVNDLVQRLLSSGPEAIAKCKELLRNVAEMSFEKAKSYTAEVIAQLRISDEGQEGMAAFFEKRNPKWDSDSGREKQRS
ncbi:MAG: enoyl-CoA hydratase/isomerase family protein [bacterium]